MRTRPRFRFNIDDLRRTVAPQAPIFVPAPQPPSAPAPSSPDKAAEQRWDGEGGTPAPAARREP
jgi:hypothetical protein